MIDETNMSAERKWFYEQQAKKVIANFQRRNINAQYVPSREEALSIILGMIPQGVTVGWGDSVTLHQVGVFSELKRRKSNEIFDPFERDAEGYLVLTEEQRLEIMRKAMTADVFLTGTNAITLDGKLVNTDARGNRVAAMVFGPKKSIFVAGANKIVRDVEEAFRRIKEIAAINAKRHFLKHHRDDFADLPCVKTGVCNDCRHPMRIC